MKYQESADKLDCKVQQIGEWVMKYAAKGLEGLNPKLGGRRHENMTYEEEAEFLEQFFEKSGSRSDSGSERDQSCI